MNRPSLSKLLVVAFVCFGLLAAPVRADDEDDMNAAFNEALNFDKAGKYAEAVPLYEKALQLCVRVNGENHADTASVLNNLALVYANQAKYSKAEALYVRSLKIREAVVGKDHPDVAQTANNLAKLDRLDLPSFDTLTSRASNFPAKMAVTLRAHLGALVAALGGEPPDGILANSATRLVPDGILADSATGLWAGNMSILS